MTTEHLKITGMTCSGCASNVERTLKSIKGVKDVVVSLSTSEATVEFDELLTSREQLKSAVVKAGYGAESYENNHHHHKGNSCCGSRESSDKVDPVCRMKVTEKSPHKFNYKNKPFYFCSQSCKTKFEVDPETYLAKKSDAGDKHPDTSSPNNAQVPAGTIYTCPMHPEVRQDHPG